MTIPFNPSPRTEFSGNQMKETNSRTLSPELLAELALRGDARQFARNETLITEGTVSDALYILVSGELKVFTQDKKGRELIYNILKPGEFFGELALDGGLRSASVKAATVAECIVVGQEQMQDLVRTSPEFAELLVHTLIERLRHATQLSRGLALNGVKERTLAVLGQVASREGELHVIPASFTQQEIANRVGATREMVNHVFRGLLEGGFLAKDENKRLLFRPLPVKA